MEEKHRDSTLLKGAYFQQGERITFGEMIRACRGPYEKETALRRNYEYCHWDLTIFSNFRNSFFCEKQQPC